MHIVGAKSLCVELNSADSLCFEGILQRQVGWDHLFVQFQRLLNGGKNNNNTAFHFNENEKILQN